YHSVCALEITSHIKNYYVARDSSVTLNCEFVFESENLGYTEIAWNIVPSDKQQDDKIIIWCTGGVIYSNLYEKLKNRVHFLTDMGTYQCKVKRLPEFGMKIFNLFVMERPSTPVCYIDGEAEEGNNLRMRCRSSQGTPPLGYNWSKANGNKMLPQSAFVDTIAGDLYLRKITESARKNSKTCTNSKTIMALAADHYGARQGSRTGHDRRFERRPAQNNWYVKPTRIERAGPPVNKIPSDDPDFSAKVRIIHRLIKAVHHLKNVSRDI
uniref:Ig-like domain-containing protein n=1 Tax=Astatotilapia calliptera TaxID=8154 RepID=A0AAX7SU19_ASTCA